MDLITDLITDLMQVGAGAITGLLVGLTGGGGALAVVLFSVGSKLWWAALE